MNYTKARCGHVTPAVGAPGSQARQEAERGLCQDCRTSLEERKKAHQQKMIDLEAAYDQAIVALDEMEEILHSMPADETPHSYGKMIQGARDDAWEAFNYCQEPEDDDEDFDDEDFDDNEEE